MTVHDLILELYSETCRCRKPKAPCHSFCPLCYRRLPVPLQTALYKRIGQGYEQAYELAVERLGPVDATIPGA